MLPKLAPAKPACSSLRRHDRILASKMSEALRVVWVALTLCACGRLSFDPLAPDASSGAPTIHYDLVRPVYGVGVAMPPLVPTVTGAPDRFDVSPALPAGMQF